MFHDEIQVPSKNLSDLFNFCNYCINQLHETIILVSLVNFGFTKR